MSSNYGFEPTLDGLNNIDADSTTTTDIICDNLTVNVSGTAPTMASSDNSTHLATTAFVNSHVSANYVTIGTTQNISGEKSFSNANTYTTGTLNCSNLSGLALNVIDDSNLSNVTIDGVSFFNDIATFNLGATFNSVLPTSTIVPVSGPDLSNKTYVDSAVLASILPLNIHLLELTVLTIRSM